MGGSMPSQRTFFLRQLSHALATRLRFPSSPSASMSSWSSWEAACAAAASAAALAADVFFAGGSAVVGAVMMPDFEVDAWPARALAFTWDEEEEDEAVAARG